VPCVAAFVSPLRILERHGRRAMNAKRRGCEPTVIAATTGVLPNYATVLPLVAYTLRRLLGSCSVY
jgi:hypothetical protein